MSLADANTAVAVLCPSVSASVIDIFRNVVLTFFSQKRSCTLEFDIVANTTQITFAENVRYVNAGTDFSDSLFMPRYMHVYVLLS